MAGLARDRTGAALAFVILLMLALLAIAHGALVGALSERAGARAAVKDLEVRTVAELGLRATLGISGSFMDSLALWETRTISVGRVGTVEARGAVTRLGVESWLIEGVGRTVGGLTARTARLAWSADPFTRVTSLPAIVSVGSAAPVMLAGTADATGPAVVREPMREEDCDPWIDALDARYRMAPIPVAASPSDTTGVPRLGLLDFAGLLGAATVTVAERGTPGPEEASGTCLVDEPWGWGDPERPWRPCGADLPMRGAAGDLVIEGGVGQVLLVVDGEVTLDGGAALFGLVVATGSLRLEGSSRFEGMALAAGGLSVGSGATLTGSACWATRALDAHAEVLGRLIPVPAAGALGPF